MGNLRSKPRNYLGLPLEHGESDKKFLRRLKGFVATMKRQVEDRGWDCDFLEIGLIFKKGAKEQVVKILAEGEAIAGGEAIAEAMKASLAPFKVEVEECTEFFFSLVRDEMLELVHFFMTYYWLPLEKVKRLGEYDQRRYQAMQTGLSLLVTKFREFLRTKNMEVLSKVTMEEMATCRLLFAVWKEGLREERKKTPIGLLCDGMRALNWDLQMLSLKDNIEKNEPLSLQAKVELDVTFFEQCALNFSYYDYFCLPLKRLRVVAIEKMETFLPIREKYEGCDSPALSKEESQILKKACIPSRVLWYKLACLKCQESNNLLSIAGGISWFESLS